MTCRLAEAKFKYSILFYQVLNPANQGGIDREKQFSRLSIDLRLDIIERG